jgi:hypothetical protein
MYRGLYDHEFFITHPAVPADAAVKGIGSPTP